MNLHNRLSKNQVLKLSIIGKHQVFGAEELYLVIEDELREKEGALSGKKRKKRNEGSKDGDITPPLDIEIQGDYFTPHHYPRTVTVSCLSERGSCYYISKEDYVSRINKYLQPNSIAKQTEVKKPFFENRLNSLQQ